MRNRIAGFAMLVALVAGSVPAVAQDEFKQAKPDGTGARLFLASGSSFEVLGPVERFDGLMYFYTTDGVSSSLREDRVRRVERRVGRRQAPSTGRSSENAVPFSFGDSRARVAYSNDDLPEDTGDAVPDDVGAEAPAGAYELQGEVEAADAEPEAREGEDEIDDLRVVVGTLRESLDSARQEETKWYRLLVCAQNGVALRGPDCNPRLLPKPSANPTRTELMLSGKMQEANRRIKELEGELERTAEEAGVNLR